jgi:hypothetical protein
MSYDAFGGKSMKARIIGPLARALISILWSLGDWLFDLFVTVERAKQWREVTIKKIREETDKNNVWQPESSFGKTWKENRKNMLKAECAYMGIEEH